MVRIGLLTISEYMGVKKDKVVFAALFFITISIRMVFK